MTSTPASTATANQGAKRLRFQRLLLGWYGKSHRDLPWRGTSDPYRVLVAEFMLQQTQVRRVESVYERFIASFPTVRALADAPVAEVIRAWSGMGYNRRAVNLHRSAAKIVAEYGAAVPSDTESLRSLPGIGRYTAAAVACFGFGLPVAVVDTNVQRVLGRVTSGPQPMAPSEAWRRAEQWIPVAPMKAPDWNQALMDLGATVCTARAPRCGDCPVRTVCVSAPGFGEMGGTPTGMEIAERRRVPPYAGRSRYYRGLIVEVLRAATGPMSLSDLARLVSAGRHPNEEAGPEGWIDGLVESLGKDGLVLRSGDRVSLP